MGYSYKIFSETKEVMKKYVNASEGAVIYSLGKTRFMEMAKRAGAIYKVGNSALVNTELFEVYLEQFHEDAKPLPKHIWKKHQESVVDAKETPDE